MKQKRINFIGSHSTGKTTLFKKINEINQGVDFFPEIAREIINEKKWTFKDIEPNSNEEKFEKFQFELIFLTLINRLKFQEDKIQFYDRSLLDPVAYLQFFFKNKVINQNLCNYLFNEASRDVNIIFKPHKKLLHWDGVRKEDSIEELMSFHDFFKKLLDDGNVPYYEIEEVDLFERMKIVKKIVYSETGVEINI